MSSSTPNESMMPLEKSGVSAVRTLDPSEARNRFSMKLDTRSAREVNIQNPAVHDVGHGFEREEAADFYRLAFVLPSGRRHLHRNSHRRVERDHPLLHFV